MSNPNETALNVMSEMIFGGSRSEALQGKSCVKCGTKDLQTVTQAQIDEYSMTALCGPCQTEWFASLEAEE